MGARKIGGTILVAALLATACTGADDANDGADPPGTVPSTTDTTTTVPSPADEPEPDVDGPAPDEPVVNDEPEMTAASPELIASIESLLAGSDQACDALDTRHCYLPWPSDHFAQSDPATPTGVRVSLPPTGGPINADGVAIDMTEWNRNDGFSPNTPLHAHIAGLDAEASDLPSWTDLGSSLHDDATVVLIDVDTGGRIALWAETDSRAETADDRLLVVHPAVALSEGHTFVVALRGLVDGDGHPVEPSPVFRAYRDANVTEIGQIEDRRDDMEAMFDTLVGDGINRAELQLAWTFTTASTENTTARMLHIRDAALAGLGDDAPTYEITAALDSTSEEVRDGTARQIVGTFTVPNWLTGDGSPGNGFMYDPADGPDALPVVNGTVEAPFVCNVPDAVMDGDQPGRMVQYGHGLLGSNFEINAGNVRDMSNEHGAVYCATKWAGMSQDDIGNAVASLQDLSNFSTLVDRLQQGLLDQVVLGRLMSADDGFVADPAFRRADGSPLIDNSRLVYDGNSQGGIMGLALVAISPDLERAVLGVPGMNYSLLLHRSVDFDTYEDILVPAYPDVVDRRLIVSMIQMLWDRGEGAGYLHHVTSDPLPGTPTTDVLLHVALGDWQVTELSAYIAARTMGIPIHRPVTAPGRSGEVEPGWGLDPIPYPVDDLDYPWEGSGIIVWDSGSDPIPIEGSPPRTSRDSHEDPRADANVRVQKAAFLFDGQLIDVCGDDQPCTAARRD
ncbi:hypothetical protein BH23ACT3_BH23ACT3_07370 [soil metagenome]